MPGLPQRTPLVLQLEMDAVPFFVDFGDLGTGQLFFDREREKGCFIWNSG